jgi:hypothetical protein
MYSDTGNTTSLVLGFPIRTSSDPRSVGSSPRHNAASHVLHRPLMPRHPPCALKHLQHKNQLIKKSKLHHNKTPKERPQPRRKGPLHQHLDARNHYARIKHHTPPPSGATTHQPRITPGPTPTKAEAMTTAPGSPERAKKQRACCLKAQQCVWQSPPAGAHPER